MSRLLVMSCSARKRPGPAPAVDLYDGSAYRVLRKQRADVPILILSAEHGLIAANTRLETYDRKMDEDRAGAFVADKQVEAARRLVTKTPGYPFDEVFVHGGALYRSVVRYYAEAGVFGSPKMRYSHGRVGEQLSQLKQFLTAGRRAVRRASFWGAH